VLALLWLDTLALEAHGGGLGAPFAVAGAVVCALLLRCAAGWREGTPWRTTVVAAFRSAPVQPLALVLLAGAALAAVALPAVSPVLLVVVLGPLTLAATAVDAWRPLPPHPSSRSRVPAASTTSREPSSD
jgi:hypothetical protein